MTIYPEDWPYLLLIVYAIGGLGVVFRLVGTDATIRGYEKYGAATVWVVLTISFFVWPAMVWCWILNGFEEKKEGGPDK